MLEWLACGVFAVSGLWLSIIDQREHRLPNSGTAGSLALYILIALASADQSALRDALVASALSTAFFAAWALVPPHSLGLGDVKLQAGLGFFLGFVDPSLVFLQVVGSVLLGGVVAGWLVVTRKLSASQHLAFGPFMIAATALAIIVGKSAETI